MAVQGKDGSVVIAQEIVGGIIPDMQGERQAEQQPSWTKPLPQWVS